MRTRRVVYLMVAAVLATAWAVAARAPRVSALTLTASPDPTVDGAPGSLRAVLATATSAGGDEIDLQTGGTYT
jgi:ABC-type nitrate/sulfonate/bicarbonate transport system substrate-binding protein